MKWAAALIWAVPMTVTPAWAGDTIFEITIENVAHDYWQARLLARQASNRSCAIKDFPLYTDPASPFARNDARMRGVEQWLNQRDPDIISAARPPGPFPPPQRLCDDADRAHRAIATYDNWVADLERRLGSTEGDA